MVGETLMLGPETFWLSATLMLERVAVWEQGWGWEARGLGRGLT